VAQVRAVLFGANLGLKELPPEKNMKHPPEENRDWTNDPRYEHGRALFNSGHYYDAHEVLEDVWRASSGPEKRFLQGLIQIAVALHHHSTGNLTGARSLLARARRNLEQYPERYGGIELAGLLVGVQQWEEALRNGKPAPKIALSS